MARRTITMWVVAVAAAGLAACGAAPEESAPVGATTAEAEQEAPAGEREQAEPNVPAEEARATDATQDVDDGETPWHLLPEDDRPEPVEQPECERASPTPAAC